MGWISCNQNQSPYCTQEWNGTEQGSNGLPAGDVGVGVGGAAAAGRGGRAPASGGQGRGRRDLAARAAVGAGRGGRAPASRGRGRGRSRRNPTAQAALAAGQGGRAPARCSRWLGGRTPVARAAGRRRRPEPGGAHCVSDVFGRDVGSGDWMRSGVGAYTIVVVLPNVLRLGKPFFLFFILKSVYFFNGYYFLLTLCRVLNCRQSAKVIFYFMCSFSLFLFKTMFS